MINKKLGYTLVGAVVIGLSACSMDGQRSEDVNYSNMQPISTQQSVKTEVKAQQKSYASKDPVQKATPGPKRAAAPQIPVIQ